MAEPPKKKIEVIDVNLGINLDDEIRKQASIDLIAQQKIGTILERAKARIKPKTKIVDPFNEKFIKLFDLMLSKPEISKSDILALLEIQSAQLGAIIAKFKRFLREDKANKWELVINAYGLRSYSLRQLTA